MKRGPSRTSPTTPVFVIRPSDQARGGMGVNIWK
jgi:hypothetical protein